MSKDVYKQAISSNECSFAYHKAIFDEDGKMIDYIFLDVNKAFEKMTGLKREEVINKRLVEDITKNRSHALEWVREYEKIVYEKKSIEFEKYSKIFNRHFMVRGFYAEDDCFVTIFLDKTAEKKIQEISEYFTRNMGTEIDYDKIAQLAHEITGAEFSVFNMFDKEGKDFKTLSIWAEPSIKKKALGIINQRIVGRTWPHDPRREALTEKQTITRFDTLIQLTNGVLPDKVVLQLERIFGIGESVVARIEKDGKVLGDFNLVFKKDEKLQNENLFRVYLSQLGLFIEKTRLLKSLDESQKRFYTLAEYAPVGFISCKRDGEITYVNKKLLEIMDSPSYEATVKLNLLKFTNLVENGFSDVLKESMDKDQVMIIELPYRSLWGKEVWVKVQFTPFKDQGVVAGANIVVDDITMEKKRREELTKMAERDPLTRAYNRHALDAIIPNRLKEAEEKGLISAIAVLDLDDFKDINDNYGHRAGDKVLMYLASRIKQELRAKDLLVRTGGDEFLVYLHDLKDEGNVSGFIDRTLDKISGKYRIEDDQKVEQKNLDVSCSIGVALYPRDGESLEELMKKADQALYQVKKNGKSDYHIII